MTTVEKLLFGAVVGLLMLALVALAGAIWWANTVVTTANTALWVERENVKALKAYAENVKKALDARTREVESLREERDRSRVGLQGKPEVTHGGTSAQPRN